MAQVAVTLGQSLGKVAQLMLPQQTERAGQANLNAAQENVMAPPTIAPKSTLRNHLDFTGA